MSSDKLRKGEINASDFGKIRDAAVEIGESPLYIDATGGLSISKLAARARRLKRMEHGLDLIIVDYLQLMSSGKKVESRQQEVSEFSRQLKLLAKELEIPLVAMSQLNRGPEQRADKRPMLSDLRESGSIEQDADVVMFVYRDEYYLAQRAPKQLNFDNSEKYAEAMDKWQQDMERAHNKAELIIAKQRHGPTGTIPLFFEGEFTRFGDLEQTRVSVAAPRLPAVTLRDSISPSSRSSAGTS